MPIFEYPNYGGTGIKVDTDSRDFGNKVEYVKKTIGADRHTLRLNSIVYPFPGAGQQFEITPAAAIVFYVKDAPVTEAEGTASCDVAGLHLDPQAAANSMLYCLGREPNALKYVDPDANKPAPKDWEVPGAKIGPPMYAEYFQFKFTGEPMGTVWTGASGRKYELVRIPGIFMALAWRGL